MNTRPISTHFNMSSMKKKLQWRKKLFEKKHQKNHTLNNLEKSSTGDEILNRAWSSKINVLHQFQKGISQIKTFSSLFFRKSWMKIAKNANFKTPEKVGGNSENLSTMIIFDINKTDNFIFRKNCQSNFFLIFWNFWKF